MAQINVDDIVGKRFNDWTVLKYDEYRVVGQEGKKVRKRHFYKCKCECGEIKSVQRVNLMKSISKSCGHKNKEKFIERNTKHGLSRDRLFRIYNEMKKRCHDEKSKDYVNYGDRGISVCAEWVNDFDAFRDWSMSNGYKENLSIDRINNNGNYEPSNCRWATIKEQALNKRTSITIEAYSPEGKVFKEIRDIKDFCQKHNLTVRKVYGCIYGEQKTHKKWRFKKYDKSSEGDAMQK
jgi:hypothetical protein